MQIEISKIRPSPFQPRLEFDLEDLKGPIIKDGIVDPLIVREIDGYYELIDGERRWRIARDLGFKEVPIDIIEADDEKADRLVWELNEDRKAYAPLERATHWRKHQQEGMTIKAIGKIHHESRTNIRAYLNIFRLPERYQNLVWTRQIGIGIITELSPQLNGGGDISTHILKILDRAATEKDFGRSDVRKILKPWIEEREKKTREAGQELAKTIEPEIKIETPEDYEKAAEALKREAKKKREAELTPEEKLEIEAKKQREKEEKERKQKEKKEKEKARIQEEAERIARQELIRDKEFREGVREDLSRPEMETLEQLEHESSLTEEDKENIRQGVAEGRIRGEKQIKEEVEWIKIQKIGEAKKDEKKEKSRELESFLKRVQKVSIELRNKLNTLRRQFQIYPETIKYLPQPQASRTAEALNLVILVMTELQKTLEGQKWQKNKEVKILPKEH